jgi:hypothetical protein
MGAAYCAMEPSMSTTFTVATLRPDDPADGADERETHEPISSLEKTCSVG